LLRVVEHDETSTKKISGKETFSSMQ